MTKESPKRHSQTRREQRSGHLYRVCPLRQERLACCAGLWESGLRGKGIDLLVPRNLPRRSSYAGDRHFDPTPDISDNSGTLAERSARFRFLPSRDEDDDSERYIAL
jgi:hypothetical protein